MTHLFPDNPYLLLVKTEKGGHVAFVGAKTNSEDRFWAENRAVEFCNLVEQQSGIISEFS
jgi:predicted alpha/beta-fold hydrolase